MAFNLAEVHNFSMIAMVFLGIVLFAMGASSFKHIDAGCDIELVRNGMMLIMTIGALAAAISITYFICTGGDCGVNKYGGQMAFIYIMASLVLGTIMLATSITMMVKLGQADKGVYTQCGGDSLKRKIIGIVFLSFLLTAGGGGYFIYDYSKRYVAKKGGSQKAEQGIEMADLGDE